MLSKWLLDPEDSTPSFQRLARNILIFTIAVNTIVLLLVSGIIIPDSRNDASTFAFSVTLAVEVIAFSLFMRGIIAPGKIVVPAALITAVTFSAVSANGMHDLSMLGFPAVIVLGSILLRSRSVYITIPLAVLGIEAVVFADMTGITQSFMAEKTDLMDALLAPILMIAIGGLLQLLIVRLNESLEDARRNEQSQYETNQKLIALQASLENRIIERTNQLSVSIKTNERRTKQFQTTAQIARLIANIRNVNDLLPSITRIISDRFGFYHVGIFLIDETRTYATLAATNSEGGQRMLQRGHRLRVGEVGIVGFVSSKGIARIALDTGADATYFNNPDLPETRSEMALPLLLGANLIGVLDVQSIEPNAFVQDDIEALTSLADQVAIAIRNGQLLRETQSAVAESQVLFSTMVKQAWKVNSQMDDNFGYRFAGTNPSPLSKPISTPEAQTAMERGEVITYPSSSEKGKKVIAVPILLRGEPIGVINVKMPPENLAGDDETDIVRASAERVAVALENASLLAEAQQRAVREQTIGEISSRISSGTDIETILRTVVRELGSQLGSTQVSVEIGGENE